MKIEFSLWEFISKIRICIYKWIEWQCHISWETSQTLLWNGDDKLKKDKIITIRVSEKEKEKLIKKSIKAELSLSEYLIEQGLERDIIIIEDVRNFIYELRKIGNNINQLTYLANE